MLIVIGLVKALAAVWLASSPLARKVEGQVAQVRHPGLHEA
jgi:hypothetical protein